MCESCQVKKKREKCGFPEIRRKNIDRWVTKRRWQNERERVSVRESWRENKRESERV